LRGFAHSLAVDPEDSDPPVLDSGDGMTADGRYCPHTSCMHIEDLSPAPSGMVLLRLVQGGRADHPDINLHNRDVETTLSSPSGSAFNLDCGIHQLDPSMPYEICNPKASTVTLRSLQPGNYDANILVSKGLKDWFAGSLNVTIQPGRTTGPFEAQLFPVP
jgi:hypothetical protein